MATGRRLPGRAAAHLQALYLGADASAMITSPSPKSYPLPHILYPTDSLIFTSHPLSRQTLGVAREDTLDKLKEAQF